MAYGSNPYKNGRGISSDDYVLSPTLLGPDGKPARLTEGQRADALAGSYDSIFANSYQFAGFNPDTLISSRGFQVLDEQLWQTPCRVGLNTARYALLSKGWKVEPFTQDRTQLPSANAQELADALNYCLNNIVDEAGNVTDFRHVIHELAYAIHTGFKAIEIVWRSLERGKYKGKWGFAEFASKPCKQIGFTLARDTLKILALTSYTPATGYQFGIPTEKVLLYTFEKRDNLPHGNGVGRTIYKHTWTRDNLLRFWNIALEIFGTPFILAKAPPGKAMQLASAALSAIRQGSTAVLPENVEAELLSIAAGGLSAFNEALTYHDQQIILSYLFSTLTTGEGTDHGTQALGTVHQDTMNYAIGFPRADIENLLSLQLVRRWVVYNFGEDALDEAPKISLGQWDSVDMQTMSGAFSNLVSMGNMHPESPVIRDKMGLPPPTQEESQKLEQKKQEEKDFQDKQLQAKQKPPGGGKN